MAAEIEAGPVVERRRIGGRLAVVGTRAKIGAGGRGGRTDGCEGHEGEQDLLHVLISEKPFGDLRAGRLPWPTQIDGFCLKCCHSPDTAIWIATCWDTNVFCA